MAGNQMNNMTTLIKRYELRQLSSTAGIVGDVKAIQDANGSLL